MIKKEWSELWKSTWFKVVLSAIILIPTVYSCVFLGSMWDPYGNAKEIPVAVVNKDQEVSYNGVTLHVGDELVKNLKEKKSMDFTFVDEKTADEGLKNGSYYMKITIPSDFSKNATTMLNKDPDKMILEYTTNPGTNYIASKMDDSAIAKIKESVSASVTETYAGTMFDQLGELSSGLQEAGEGTDTLNSGMEELINGTAEISSNLNTLADSSLTFKNGADTLSTGLKNYTNAVMQIYHGSEELNANSTALNQGVSDLKSGIETMHQGVSLIQNKLQEASDTIAINLAAKAGDIEKLQSGNYAVEKGAGDLSTQISSPQVKQAMELATDHATIAAIQTSSNLTPEQKAAVIGTLQGSKAVNSALLGDEKHPGLLPRAQTVTAGSNEAMKTLTGSLQQIKAGLDGTDTQTGAIQGLAAVNGGMTQAEDSMKQQLIPGLSKYTGGVTTLHQALSELSSNNQTLLSGSGQLADGSLQISEGAGLLAQGSVTLQTGLESAKAGTQTLNTKLKEGAEKSSLNTTSKNLNMMASPVEVSHTEISTVTNNGHAMAPYMMSVALYVACMAFNLMYPMLKQISSAKSGFQYWLSKASVMYGTAILQAIVMVGALILINGLEPSQMMMTFVFACVVSMAFMSMVTFFNITLGKVGSFLVLIFMVLQLGGAAGTYPLETSSGFYKVLHPLMPFSYSVEGFRHTLSMQNFLASDMLVFIAIILVFSVLSILFYEYRRKHERVFLEKAFD